MIGVVVDNGQPSGWWRRAGAVLIDAVLTTVVASVIVWPFRTRVVRDAR